MLKADFVVSEEVKAIDKFAKISIANVFRALAYIGETFINKARNTESYNDITGNLRASTGYTLFKGGGHNKDSFDNSEGGLAGMEAASEVEKSKDANVVELVGVAGMDYAAAVEAKGYDVITGSTPTAEEFDQDLRELLGL